MEHKIAYKLSRDYARLQELLHKEYRIVCFVDYNFKELEGKYPPCRDVCMAKYKSEYKEYDIGSRGICYISWNYNSAKKFKENYLSFVQVCEMSNVEFIDII